jgi:hypothetical protein
MWGGPGPLGGESSSIIKDDKTPVRYATFLAQDGPGEFLSLAHARVKTNAFQSPAPPGSLYMRHNPDYYITRILHARQSARHNPGPPLSSFTETRVTWAEHCTWDGVFPEVLPEGIFRVRRIIGYRKHPKMGHQYLVRWGGFPLKDSTWEPYENLKDTEAMDDWEKRQGRKVG